MVLISAILLPIGFATKSFIRVKKRDIKWFAIVTLSGAATFAPYFYAFNHLAIGTATLLFYAALTITIYIVGKLFLKEKMTLVKLASLIIALVGLSLIFTISFGQGLLIPALAAIFAGSAGGCEVAFTKKISGSYSSVQITTILFLVSLVLHLPLSLLLGETQVIPNFTQPWFAQIGYALVQVGAFFFVVIGYNHLEASIAAILGLGEILVAVAIGILLFGEALTGSVILGGLLIIIAGILPNMPQKIWQRYLWSNC